jgi:hypothetical protein
MVTSEKVFGKIKEMSLKTLNPYHRILLKDITAEFLIPQDSLFILLVELENRGLIKIYNTSVVSVSLTNYGATHDNPPGGVNSEEN